jgi:hypothetical protein
LNFLEIVLKVMELGTAGQSDEDGFLDLSNLATVRKAHEEDRRVGEPLRTFMGSLPDEAVLKLYILMRAGQNRVSDSDFSLLRKRLDRLSNLEAIRIMVEKKNSLGIYLSHGLKLLQGSQLDPEGPL